MNCLRTNAWHRHLTVTTMSTASEALRLGEDQQEQSMRRRKELKEEEMQRRKRRNKHWKGEMSKESLGEEGLRQQFKPHLNILKALKGAKHLSLSLGS